ncbi:MAG: hypothetical protein FWG41_01755 [Methanomassiliicoccaceae archaeon]|nr:hypothetical protein [Methanomassiliicoccaceae archaeon]
MNCIIDVDHDFWKNYRTDKKDPDSHDTLLREYHRLLWSKPLPDGRPLLLDRYLQHNSELGSFSFSSDSFMHTYSGWKRYQNVIGQIPKEEIEYFYRVASTIGAITIFPSNKVNGMRTINGEKGCNAGILDRIDLTMECIRRHYAGESSPMSATLERYASFFGLFGDFKGYVDFFLMQDMVDNSCSVKFLCEFGDFNSSPLPAGVEEYMRYKENAIAFVTKRNLRIKKWAEENL